MAETTVSFVLEKLYTRAADEGEGGSSEGVKTWVKQLREASFRIEDVIDCYSIDEIKPQVHGSSEVVIKEYRFERELFNSINFS
ncbi:hypothetical protein MTR_3g012190 [Medicago truncatula]|uniref:Disease resistance N-terminal domain-containing protein n=1 Tax=Medicago truncatula TaxID=3880 RepID=A0A072V490_MEDTR|nr:hypothetical protein MTR_3g012190 [Medicago truncatula]